jgi:diguanylate cyclase (GGDEF)-like protein
MPDAAVRVLLVGERRDDYLTVSRALAAIRTRPHQLRWCNRLEQALPRMLSTDVDIILLDAQQRDDRALALLQGAVEHQCAAPIILMGDDIDIDIDQTALPDGAADYLSSAGLLDAHLLSRSLRYAIERKRAEKRLLQQSQRDPLTGLPNRLLLRDRLQHALELARRHHTPLALLHININGFRRINDAYGCETGDCVLTQVALRLQACVRRTDTLARIGGDEFAIVLEDARSLVGVVAVVEKVQAMLAQPLPLDAADTHGLTISASIGIAMFPEAGGSVDALMRNADLALQQVQQTGRVGHHFYCEDLDRRALEQLHLEQDLRRALRRNEFELYYQPRVELESGEIIGVEALLRWRHPERGLLAPIEFIPLAEETGLIVPIGYWVVHRACRDLQYLGSRGHDRLNLAVNLSCRQFQDEHFVATVTRLLQQGGIDLQRVEFELTETAIMLNTDHMHDSMRALSALGVSFSLDDFGTGYSSFAHIQRLPIDALKIDRAFVRQLPHNGDDAIIVRAMINLARNLQLQVIAEGAETLEQVQFLWENQCHQVQGYYFSPALSLENFVDILERRAVASM